MDFVLDLKPRLKELPGFQRKVMKVVYFMQFEKGRVAGDDA